MLLLPSLSIPSVARRGTALIAAVAASLALGACTTQSQDEELSGAEGEVQRVITNFSERADAGDAAGICDRVLTPAAKAALSRNGDCAANVKKAIDSADYVSLTVDVVRIAGLNAIATITPATKDTGDTQIVLARAAEGQPWRVSAFGNAAATAISNAGSTPAGSTPAGSTPATTPEG